MRKTMVYSVAAIILGLALTLLPWVTFAQIRVPEEAYTYTFSSDYDIYNTEKQKEQISDIEALAISFFIAITAYIVIRRKWPHRTYRRMGDPLYYF